MGGGEKVRADMAAFQSDFSFVKLLNFSTCSLEALRKEEEG